MPIDTSRNNKTFRGSGLTLANPAIWTTEEAFTFGASLIPAGTQVKQFETTDFGITTWIQDGRPRFARE